ncbi:hypothetical protein LXL04_037682 [Taraxacum kok-saghyz]
MADASNIALPPYSDKEFLEACRAFNEVDKKLPLKSYTNATWLLLSIEVKRQMKVADKKEHYAYDQLKQKLMEMNYGFHNSELTEELMTLCRKGDGLFFNNFRVTKEEIDQFVEELEQKRIEQETIEKAAEDEDEDEDDDDDDEKDAGKKGIDDKDAGKKGTGTDEKDAGKKGTDEKVVAAK